MQKSILEQGEDVEQKQGINMERTRQKIEKNEQEKLNENIDAFYEGWKEVMGKYPIVEEDFDPIIFHEDIPYMTATQAFAFGKRRARQTNREK